MSNALRRWLDAANREQAERLAKLSNTSLATLRQIAGGYRTNGSASTTPTTAKAIEKAAARIPGLPPLTRGDLCPACHNCEYFKERKDA